MLPRGGRSDGLCTAFLRTSPPRGGEFNGHRFLPGSVSQERTGLGRVADRVAGFRWSPHPPARTNHIMDHQHSADIVQAIVALATAGLSRAQIAAQIGGLSRSAVCGVLWRKGFTTPKPETKAKPARQPRRIKPVKAKPVRTVVPMGTTLAGTGVPWCDLDTTRCCTWPVQGGLWCGEAKTDGSYCREHFALAYRRAA